MTDYGITVERLSAPTDRKDPDATERFTFNFAAELDGETISTSDFVLPDGLTEGSSSDTDSSASVLVSGGSEGLVYRLTCRITTSGGRTLDQTKWILISEQ